MSAPEQDLATHIGVSLGAWTLGTNLFYGPYRDAGGSIPVNAVFCAPTAGLPIDEYIDNGAAGVEMYYSGVQIHVRGARDADAATLAQARAILAAVHHATIAGYLDVYVTSSEPLPVQMTGELSSRFSINVIMQHRQ